MRNQFLGAWALALAMVLGMATLGSTVEQPPGVETHVMTNANTFDLHDVGAVSNHGPAITTSGGAAVEVGRHDTMISTYFGAPADPLDLFVVRPSVDMSYLDLPAARRERLPTTVSEPATNSMVVTSRSIGAPAAREVMQT